MHVKYLDPYKDDKYGKLKGDKSEAYFKVTFDEAVVHKTDDAYILAGNVSDYQGIIRGFKPEMPLLPGLCAVPIYGQEYEIRKKDKDGNWSSDKITPSLFEKALHDWIQANESNLKPDNAAIKVELSHVPNGMCASQDKAGLEAVVNQNFIYEQRPSSGSLPQYTPPTGGGQRKSWGGVKSPSFDEKIVFLKKQLSEDIKDPMYKQGQCLADLTDQMIKEHSDNENFIEIYFEMLISCVR